MFVVQADQTRKYFAGFDAALLEARLLAYQLKVKAVVIEVSSSNGWNQYATLRVVQPEVATHG